MSGNALRAGKRVELVQKKTLLQKSAIQKIGASDEASAIPMHTVFHGFSMLFIAFLDPFLTCKSPTTSMSQDTFQLQLHWIQALRRTSSLLDTELSKDIQTNRVESVEQNEGDVFYLRGL